MIDLSRRRLLAAAGLSAAFIAAPGLAAAADARKLVFVVLRGAMDGLSAAPPIGDPNYERLRGPIAIPAAAALPLDSAFGLHPKLKSLHALALAGEARIAPAAAIPERIRSHFEAQDLLESGGPRLYAAATGWLNRAIQVSGARAISIGAQEPLILKGPAESRSWSPGGRKRPDVARLASAVQDLYQSDPLLGPALASGLETQREAEALAAGVLTRADARGFAVAAARFLTDPGGPSIAVLSLDGFDTHAAQGGVEGQLAQRLANLDGLMEGLKEGLGPDWGRTVVVAATEFGRTARMNGTRGTDHGTASTLILAGGALRPGGVVGDWPGLRDGALFENRDLAPTLDVRSVFKAVLRDHLGVDKAALDQKVFPDSRLAPALDGLVRT